MSFDPRRSACVAFLVAVQAFALGADTKWVVALPTGGARSGVYQISGDIKLPPQPLNITRAAEGKATPRSFSSPEDLVEELMIRWKSLDFIGAAELYPVGLRAAYLESVENPAAKVQYDMLARAMQSAAVLANVPTSKGQRIVVVRIDTGASKVVVPINCIAHPAGGWALLSHGEAREEDMPAELLTYLKDKDLDESTLRRVE